MLQFLILIFSVLLLTLPAVAQIYDGKAEEITAPFDKAIEQANALYANEAIAGASEDATPQDIRYTNMTSAMNEANEHHFDAFKNAVK